LDGARYARRQFVGPERDVIEEGRHGYRGEDHQGYIHSVPIHAAQLAGQSNVPRLEVRNGDRLVFDDADALASENV
jgi:hypothetical protein